MIYYYVDECVPILRNIGVERLKSPQAKTRDFKYCVLATTDSELFEFDIPVGSLDGLTVLTVPFLRAATAVQPVVPFPIAACQRCATDSCAG